MVSQPPRASQDLIAAVISEMSTSGPSRKSSDFRHESVMRTITDITGWDPSVIFSINVGSSSGARELFTRFDTGHRCK